MHQQMFSRYERLGGPVPIGSGIMVPGDWRQSWENLRMYWNLACDAELWKTTAKLAVVSKALEVIAKVHAEFSGVPSDKDEK